MFAIIQMTETLFYFVDNNSPKFGTLQRNVSNHPRTASTVALHLAWCPNSPRTWLTHAFNDTPSPPLLLDFETHIHTVARHRSTHKDDKPFHWAVLDNTKPLPSVYPPQDLEIMHNWTRHDG